MEFVIGGVIDIDCKDEAYTYDGASTITLDNVGTAGDCAHDALESNKVTLKSISYDNGSDEITVSVKYSVLSLDVVLSKSGAVTVITTDSTPIAELVDTYYDVFAANAAPSGSYSGSKTVLGEVSY